MKALMNTDHSPFLAPTEGLWGLSGRADSLAVCQRIAHLKNREMSKGFIVLYTHKTSKIISQWINWDQIDIDDRLYYQKHKFKFVSFLLPVTSQAPKHLVKEQKILLRYIHYGSIKKIIDSIKVPIVSTSANLTGQEPIIRMNLLKKFFPDLPIVKGSLGGQKKSSTIIDLQSKRKIR